MKSFWVKIETNLKIKKQITQLKRKQEKEAKMNEIYGQKIYDNFERVFEKKNYL